MDAAKHHAPAPGLGLPGRVVTLGERHLRFLVHEYVEQYYRERNYQGVGTGPRARTSV